MKHALLHAFDVSVASMHLLDSPRPNYDLYSKAEWHTRGIRQGLKIARTILEENLKLNPYPTCWKCGELVEDGLKTCAHCNGGK